MVIVTVMVMMVVVVVMVRVMDRTPFFEVCLDREINDRIEKRNNIYDYISHAERESFF